ncbi:MAG: 2-phosphosulfolactate phosphatase [Deltaproteobacteria bacterium]|nr:2-phosphosulfolactate phosphatase [Deltaproteobacteria bacterium]MBM4324021.1 2-phosphosulfolactate phosphatase [Deltaproteobacteria bacterium]MBM4346915.1 2-phosphosulfolactate phosphatase [Deltaproteobacteria bacterium]
MRIDIQFLPVPPDPLALSRKTVVVIDVLRATSVIVHATSQGVLEIIPVATVEEAFEKAKDFPPGSTLLGGERGSKKIEGFDLGNSPREYIAEKVRGKRLILTTTNGTKAFHSVSSGKKVIAGSFFNIGAITKVCLDMNQNVLLYPSGDGGRFSLEDTICGGMLIDRIVKTEGDSIALTDAAHSAHILYQRFEANLIDVFYASIHGRDLVAKGFEADLAYCAQVDIIDIVPTFRDGVIRSR